MVVVRYSKSALQKIIAHFSAVVVIGIGLFAIFFASTPRIFQQGNTANPEGSGVVYADAPACESSCLSCASCGDGSSDGSADSGCDGCCDSP